DPQTDLTIGRWLTLLILLGGMGFAPFIGELGGIYVFIQSLLSLFQGPMLALLVLGAFTRHVTPTAGLITLVSGIAIAGVLMAGGMNMLYVAFSTFCYAMVALWALSYRTAPLSSDALDQLVYGRG
ncbi:MAG: hypothetical protein P8Y69_13905, partial [Gammaproteobacteria bacterium]